MVAWRLDLFTNCFAELRKAGVDGSDIYMADAIRIIPCSNELEKLGIVVKANEFIQDFTILNETFEDTYRTLQAHCGGRFFCDKKYFIKGTDNFYVKAFIHGRDGMAYAEIVSTRNFTAAYVRL